MTNTTALNNTWGLNELVAGVQVATDYTFGIATCLFFSLIVFAGYKSRGFEFMESLAPAASLNMILSIIGFFWQPGGVSFVPDMYLMFSIAGFIMVLIYYISQK